MAVSISVSPTVPKVDQAATVSISGAASNTMYVLRISHPGGTTESHTVTTNGSGAATQTYVPQEGGTCTYNLDPVATANGAAGSVTAVHGH